jgi:hypothetical protein
VLSRSINILTLWRHLMTQWRKIICITIQNALLHTWVNTCSNGDPSQCMPKWGTWVNASQNGGGFLQDTVSPMGDIVHYSIGIICHYTGHHQIHYTKLKCNEHRQTRLHVFVISYSSWLQVHCMTFRRFIDHLRYKLNDVMNSKMPRTLFQWPWSLDVDRLCDVACTE